MNSISSIRLFSEVALHQPPLLPPLTPDQVTNVERELGVSNFEEPVLSNSVLASAFTYGDSPVEYGREVIERISTIPLMKAIIQKRLEYLTTSFQGNTHQFVREHENLHAMLDTCEKALTGQSHIPEPIKQEIDKIKRQIRDNEKTLSVYVSTHHAFRPALNLHIERLQQQLKDLRECLKFDWIGSNYFRDCLTECKELESEDFLHAGQAYNELTKMIIPAAVNLRRQEIIAGNGTKATVLRTGVMSDMRNGYVSLEDLVKMESDDNLRQLKLEELFEEKKKARTNPAKAVLKYAIDQLKSQEALHQSVQERRFFLQTQMLMVILEHVKTMEKNGVLDAASGLTKLPIMHLSLLNRTTNAVDATGWKKNEEVFMSDMAQIYKEFDGKELIFDGKGPLVDFDGNIHLPAEFGDQHANVTLNTFFANLSVQNHTVNDGKQEEINQEFLRKFRDFGDAADFFDAYLSLRIQVLLNGQSNFLIAEQLASLALKSGMYLSVGCLSGKDRTGFVCGRIGVNHVLENYCGQLTGTEKIRREEAWSTKILRGPALGVCNECNLRSLYPVKVRALKLTHRDLPGVALDERIVQYGKLVDMTVFPKSERAQRAKVSPPKRPEFSPERERAHSKGRKMATSAKVAVLTKQQLEPKPAPVSHQMQIPGIIQTQPNPIDLSSTSPLNTRFSSPVKDDKPMDDLRARIIRSPQKGRVRRLVQLYEGIAQK